MGYRARYVFVAPSDDDDLESLFKEAGIDDEVRLQELSKAAKNDIEHSSTEGFYETAIRGSDSEDAAQALIAFIYGADASMDGADEDSSADTNEVNDEEDITMGNDGGEQAATPVETMSEAIQNGVEATEAAVSQT